MASVEDERAQLKRLGVLSLPKALMYRTIPCVLGEKNASNTLTTTGHANHASLKLSFTVHISYCHHKRHWSHLVGSDD